MSMRLPVIIEENEKGRVGWYELLWKFTVRDFVVGVGRVLVWRSQVPPRVKNCLRMRGWLLGDT
jgi:hypothetical protein